MAKKKSVMSKIVPIIALVLIIAVIGTTAGYFSYKNRIIYNISPGANGNTSGNLQNKGLFCELDGKVYFSNPYDRGKLYCMDSDGKNIKKLNDESVYSINACGKYLYYSKNNLTSSNSTAAFRGTLFSAIRSDLDGKHVVTLCEDYSATLVLVGNKVYFQRYTNNDQKQTNGALYNVGIDKKDLSVAVKSDINPACVNGAYIFYTGVEKDHNIYRLNTATNSSSLYYEGNCYKCIVDDNELYFIDAEDNYKLKKTGASSTRSVETVLNERISTYNIDSNYIYFQIDDQENGMLCRIKKDGGSEYEIIAKGNYDNINVTSKYIYFHNIKNESEIYRAPTNGPVIAQKLSEVLKFPEID